MGDSGKVFDAARHVSAKLIMERLPPRGGSRFASAFRHGSLQVEMYAPRGRDAQRPHDRDEMYLVVQGTGHYVNGTQRFAYQPGDILFAAAGEEHHFEDAGEDFFAWVFFYGPEGGEKPR